MIDRTSVVIAVAIATIVVPLIFLAVVIAAWWRRNRGASLGPRFEALLSVLGAGSLGTMALMTASSLVIGAPIYVVVVLAVLTSLRRRRRVQAGWLVAGFALPWTILWSVYVVALIGGENFEPGATWAGFLGGLVIVVAGMALVARGDPERRAPEPSRTAGQPGPRSFSGIANAINEPSRVGPFRAPDIAAVVALVVTWTVIGLLPSPSRIVSLAAATVIGAIVATEASIRARPAPSRRAFEAFSWFGEWELDRARALTGSPVPTTPGAADKWLREHPETPDTLGIRAEILTMAGRIDDARAAVERMASETAFERFERAALEDVVDWFGGGDGDLPGLEAAVADLGPMDSDVRLRGEVALATAKVRRLVAEGPLSTATIRPFLDVRELLGTRADGQVGRALRKRMIPAFLIFGALFGVIELVLGPGTIGP